jgi:dienelactone hydrolase
MWRAILVVIATLGIAPARAQSMSEPFTAPVTADDGTVTMMQASLCRPATPGPARLVVIAHGSPPNAAARPRMRLTPCDNEAVSWFTRQGYAVAIFLRRGYGATGGSWDEGSGPCRRVDYVRSGLETARDIDAAVNAATQRPDVRPDGVVVVGQSAGGWGVVAYDSVPHPKVIALVSMAGGRGGHEHDQPNENCRPDALATAAGRFGAQAGTPMLWVYTANDSYFAPPIATAMHDSFVQSGGHADLHQIDAFGADGHLMFFSRGSAAVWGPLVAGYLAQMHALPH